MSLNDFREKIARRGFIAWRDAAGSGIAVVLAWILAQWLFGHDRPMFAAVTAIVCLAPGLPNHFRQTLGMLVGVATGILIGEAVFFLPDEYFLLRLVMASSVAVFVPALYGLAPVVAIQSGVSAVLVLVLGAHDAGPERMLDVLVGAGVGLVFSQILMTPDPVRQVQIAAGDVLDQVRGGLQSCQEALSSGNSSMSDHALQRISRARGRLGVLDTDLNAATDAAIWTLRGRLAGAEVGQAVRRYDRHIVRIYASALLFADALFHALRDEPENVPTSLDNDLKTVISRLSMGTREVAMLPLISSKSTRPETEVWQRCFNALETLADAVSDLAGPGPLTSRRGKVELRTPDNDNT